MVFQRQAVPFGSAPRTVHRNGLEEMGSERHLRVLDVDGGLEQRLEILPHHDLAAQWMVFTGGSIKRRYESIRQKRSGGFQAFPALETVNGADRHLSGITIR